ncbi:alpha-acetolactate decarboxylase [Diplogelasinospora grovesii]|uniref:Alpha-acetolactate decarboxylase n=1 Tax=Diplogelasinospora grovesii TaxID=303347 RepID=A0AAN6N5B3_9PEZI|nr:alpha-acetolactate decarboxylase [Diplogelasinospora grovesii]
MNQRPQSACHETQNNTDNNTKNHPKHAGQIKSNKMNEIYQYSIISALMDGVASSGIPLSTLLTHGNHGLGTFKSMVGEMIVLDSEVYQMKADGSVIHIDSSSLTLQSTITPFATVTKFQPTLTTRASISNKKDLSNILKRLGLLPRSRNHFLSIRMDGAFKSITFRTCGGQTFPGEKLPSVASRQVTERFTNENGTIFGFRCPDYSSGINVAGDHLHFISDDRRRGGHILELETDGEVEVKVAVIHKVHMELPDGDDEFDKADLTGDKEGIAVVEG